MRDFRVHDIHDSRHQDDSFSRLEKFLNIIPGLWAYSLQAWYADKSLTVVVKVNGEERAFEFFPHVMPLKVSLLRSRLP